MSWSLDVIFFVIMALGILIGVKRGFIAGICKIAGTIFAIAVAFLFCNSFGGLLESWFGLTTAMGGGQLAGWLTIAISFVILFIIVKLLAWIVGKLGTSLAEKLEVFNIINRLLGGILGLLKAFVFFLIVLVVSYWMIVWFDLSGLDEFIQSSTVIGALFRTNWFVNIAHLHFIFPSL